MSFTAFSHRMLITIATTICATCLGWTPSSALAQDADNPVAGTQSESPLPASGTVNQTSDSPWAKSRRHGLEEPKPRTPGAIRFANYNIENLFDDKDDPKLSGKQEDATMTKPVEDRRNAAKAIRLIDADVLCLEEVESLEAVTWFRDEFLKDMGYNHVQSLDAGDGRGIEQAVLSRFPLSGAKVWPEQDLGGTHPRRRNAEADAEPGSPIKLHRSPMLVSVSIPAGSVKGADGKANDKEYKLWVMALHHKSGKPNGYWREAEARQFVKWASELQSADPNANIIICGDFNARAGDLSVKTYFDSGFADAFVVGGVKKPRSDASPTTPATDKPDSAMTESSPPNTGGANASRPNPGDSELDPSMITHASERTIDFILMNANAAKELVPLSPFVLGTGARERGADYRNTPSPAGWASDHYPLVIDLIPSDR